MTDGSGPQLRRITHADAEDPLLIGWHTDPAGYALMHEEPEPPEAVGRMLAAWADAWDRDGVSYWVAEQDGVPVGVGGVRRLSHEGRDYLNLYYRVDPSAWGSGLGREIARAGTAYAAEYVPELTVLARIAPANKPSTATVRRAGMFDVGPFRAPADPPHLPAPISWQGPVVRSGAPDGPGREAMVDLWCRVNDTGGAVGFEIGAPRDEVAVRLDEALADSERTLVRLFAPTPATWDDADSCGALVGFGFVLRGVGPIVSHRRWLLTVMTDPDLRGHGLGGVLLGALHAEARQDGGEIVSIAYRGGTGLERFYERAGYVESGRIRDGLRFSYGLRDDVTMTRRLDRPW